MVSAASVRVDFTRRWGTSQTTIFVVFRVQGREESNAGSDLTKLFDEGQSFNQGLTDAFAYCGSAYSSLPTPPAAR